MEGVFHSLRIQTTADSFFLFKTNQNTQKWTSFKDWSLLMGQSPCRDTVGMNNCISLHMTGSSY